MEDKLNFIIWVAMFFTAISIMAFVYGYSGDLNLFFSDGQGISSPEQVDIQGDSSDDLSFNDEEYQGFWGGLKKNWEIFKYKAGVLWGKVTGVVKSLPIIGAIWEAFEWAYSGLVFILALMTLQVFPEDMPLIIQVLFVTPIYSGLLYIIVPVIHDILQNAPTT